ncbi:MAG: hypothetical protein KA409_13090, partial [Ferruginibacter sp.]|nr:hypothetical protein [Ferruginibacter sp.]
VAGHRPRHGGTGLRIASHGRNGVVFDQPEPTVFFTERKAENTHWFCRYHSDMQLGRKTLATVLSLVAGQRPRHGGTGLRIVSHGRHGENDPLIFVEQFS